MLTATWTGMSDAWREEMCMFHDQMTKINDQELQWTQREQKFGEILNKNKYEEISH